MDTNLQSLKSSRGKRGLSGVVATVLLVLLVIVSAGIIWGVVNNLLKDELSGAQSCFNTFEKIKVNDRFTCLNTTDNLIHLSLEIGNIEVDSVTVSIAGPENSKSFKIQSAATGGSSYIYAKYLGGTSFGEQIVAPGNNSGITYSIDLNTFGVANSRSISIAPEIDEEQCEVSDSLNILEDCRKIIG